MKAGSRIVRIVCSLVLAAICTAATAEMNQIKIGRAVSVGYLPIMVMEDRKLMEKHAKAAGLGDISVEYVSMTGGTQLNDALLADSLQIATGCTAPFVLLWARTRGNIEVKGLSPFNSMPLYLNTRNPNIKSIKDFTAQDRIAVVALAERALGGLAHGGEGLGQDVVERFAVAEALAEGVGAGAQGFVGQDLDLVLERVDADDGFFLPLEEAGVGRSEDALGESGEHRGVPVVPVTVRPSDMAEFPERGL